MALALKSSTPPEALLARVRVDPVADTAVAGVPIPQAPTTSTGVVEGLPKLSLPTTAVVDPNTWHLDNVTLSNAVPLLEELGIEPSERAEQLSIADFCRLSARLAEVSGAAPIQNGGALDDE